MIFVRDVFELTPLQCITEVRLKNASRLLRTTKIAIDQVGHQCGFENGSAFIRLFRSKFLKTPQQFRKDAIHVRRRPNGPLN
jgi:AraC-like DNA-binding protein